MSAVALVPEASLPLYQRGHFSTPPRTRYLSAVQTPRIPLYQLGDFGVDPARIVAATGPIAATVTTAAISSMAASGTALASLAGPIGAGVGLLVGVIAGLWAAHEARVKGATTENAVVNSAVQAFDSILKAIFAAANSSDPTQNISAAQAEQMVGQAYQSWWQRTCPYTSGPGRADTSACGANCGGPTNLAAPCSGMPGGHKCDKSCTASCCVGCQDIKPTVDAAIALFQSGKGGSIQACNVSGSHFGYSGRPSYTLTWTPPVVNPLSAVSSVFGGQSLSPLLLLAAGLFLAGKFL